MVFTNAKNATVLFGGIRHLLPMFIREINVWHNLKTIYEWWFLMYGHTGSPKQSIKSDPGYALYFNDDEGNEFLMTRILILRQLFYRKKDRRDEKRLSDADVIIANRGKNHPPQLLLIETLNP